MIITASNNLAPVNMSALPVPQVKQDFPAAASSSSKGPRKVAFSITIPPAVANTSWNGLAPGKNYTLRLVAKNDAGSSYADHPFSIVAAPPTVNIVVCAWYLAMLERITWVLSRSPLPTPRHYRL